MTTFECTLLIINILFSILFYFVNKKHKKEIEDYQKYLLKASTSLENTLMQIDNLHVALDDCKKKKVTKKKASKDEEKTITK